MPVLSVVIPRLKTNQLKWSFTGAFEVCEQPVPFFNLFYLNVFIFICVVCVCVFGGGGLKIIISNITMGLQGFSY
jgi:hypothetical protein